MSSNPTPGPWLYYAGPPGRVLGPHRPRKGRLIVCDNLYPSQEADGRLIAAAPELLAAVEHARNYLRRPNFDAGMRDAVAGVMEAAIFKATGVQS